MFRIRSLQHFTCPSGWGFALILLTLMGCDPSEATLPGDADGGGAESPTAPTEVPAPCVGAWQVLGYPNAPDRMEGTTTLLPTGELLVTGGAPGSSLPTDGGTATDLALSAELFDPESNSWRLTPTAMAEGRRRAQATLLADGRVLVSGSIGQTRGMGDTGIQNTAELFNPADGTWAKAARLNVRRFGHTATLLADGRVLVAGGWGECLPECHALSSTELYDPTSDTWTPAAPMHTERIAHAALRLPNGEVLVTGRDPVEIFNPATGTWREGPPMPRERFGHLLLPLPSGRIMAVGGYEYDAQGRALTTADIFNPTSGTWEALPPLDRPRTFPAGTLLADGRVLLGGGWVGPRESSVAYTDVFDEWKGTWVHGPDLKHPRRYLLLSALPDGTAIAISGAANRSTDDSAVDPTRLPAERFMPEACE